MSNERALTPSAKRDFSAAVDEVGAARHFARSVAEDWGISADEVVLVVGELAANSHRHAQTDFSVSIGYSDETVLVEVADASPDVPSVVVPSPDSRSGRGLVIVDRIARSWGTRPMSGGGKTVWVELDANG